MVFILLLMFGVLLIGSVNATDTINETIENTNEILDINEEYNLDLNESNYQSFDEHDNCECKISSSCEDNQISKNDDNDVLNYLPSNAYYVSKIGSYGSVNGVNSIGVYLNFNSTYEYADYSYKFYYTLHRGSASSPILTGDTYSGEFEKKNNEFQTAYQKCIVNKKLDPGNYRITIINVADNKVVGTKNFTIKTDQAPPWGSYSFNVSCNTITCESGGVITITYSKYAPDYFKYKFAYKLSIFNKDTGKTVFTKFINSTANVLRTTVNVDKWYDSGNYQLSIVNCRENYLMKTLDFNIYSENYAINVLPIDITCENGGKINLNLSSFEPYFKYDFYLFIYDSNDDLKVGKRYYNVSSKSLNLEHIIAPNKLDSGNYTLLIKNTGGDLLKNIAFNVSNEINNKQESSSSQPQYSQNNIPAIEKISLSLKKVTVKKHC